MNPKTDIKISEDILKKTSRCKKNFSCLSGEISTLCKVEFCIEDKIHFIRCVTTMPCSYKIPFGYSYVCICPVRKELHNRYKI
ncbi:MAG: hypothetical protein OIN66_11535 [Candidatus Methanoperedens sp.]|nr:hypothetical protein [Candidatus Methanoperedens sp.]